MEEEKRCLCCGCRNTSEDGELCPQCQNMYDCGDIIICEACGDYIVVEHAIYAEDTGDVYCAYCAEHNLYHCDDCGCWYARGSLMNSDDCGTNVCDDCYVDYTRCADCDRIIHLDNANWHRDSAYCECCIDGHSDCVHEYGYRPYPEFSRTGKDSSDPTYLGFELEAGGTSSRAADEAANVIDSTGLPCYLKEDCSIPSCGFELVTHPCTLNYHIEAGWDKALKVMRDNGMKSHDIDDCGLHVHVSRRSLTPHQWLIVDWFVHRHKAEWECIARRSESSWAAFKTKSDGETLKSIYGHGDDRYRAVNFCNRNTVEFRLFKGSLRYETLIGTLSLVDALIDWAKTVTCNDLLTQGVWQSYITHVKSDNKWSAAVDYLRYRHLV